MPCRCITTTAALTAVLLGALTGCDSFRALTGKTEPRPVPILEPTPEQLERLESANAASAAGHYDTALSMFQEILAVNPTITPAYLGIGAIYMVKNDYVRAEPVYGRAARLEPLSFDAQYGHGLALQMLQRFVDAVRAYRRALTIDPDSGKANLNIATTYLQMRDSIRALSYAEKAVAVDPSNGPSHANLGAIYENLGRNAEAIDQYYDALELMGNRPRLMMNLMSVLAKERRYREAANTAETLIRIEPTAHAYERLGWCHFKLRRYDESIAAYRDAVEFDAGHWPALNGIGVNALNTWLLSEKRDEAAMVEARTAFRRSLQANPDQQKVISLLLNYNL